MAYANPVLGKLRKLCDMINQEFTLGIVYLEAAFRLF